MVICNRVSVTIILILIIISSLIIRIFIRYKISGTKGIKDFFKTILIGILCSVLIFAAYYFMPKYDVEIDIIIKNENTIAEIHINDNFYTISENINIYNIDKERGFIAIKTENNNIIVYYLNDKSIFSFNRKININLENGNISINSHFVKITRWIENRENYDSFLEILKRNR